MRYDEKDELHKFDKYQNPTTLANYINIYDEDGYEKKPPPIKEMEAFEKEIQLRYEVRLEKK